MSNFKTTNIQMHRDSVKARHQEKWGLKLKVVIKMNMQNSSYSVSQLADKMGMSARGLSETPTKFIALLVLELTNYNNS